MKIVLGGPPPPDHIPWKKYKKTGRGRCYDEEDRMIMETPMPDMHLTYAQQVAKCSQRTPSASASSGATVLTPAARPVTPVIRQPPPVRLPPPVPPATLIFASMAQSSQVQSEPWVPAKRKTQDEQHGPQEVEPPVPPVRKAVHFEDREEESPDWTADATDESSSYGSWTRISWTGSENQW